VGDANQKSDGRYIAALVASFDSEDGSSREKARKSLVAIGEPAVSRLVKAMKNESDQVRWEAAKTLVQIASENSAESLVNALRDKSFEVRWLAADGLINIGIRSTEPLLQALIDHPSNAMLLEGAHHVLSHLAVKDISSLHHIESHLKDTDAGMGQVLKPILAAIESPTPAIDVPLAAKSALTLVKSSRK